MSQSASRRGRTHNAAGAREAILNAAESVFAEHGFDGTRVDTIAQEAGYNKSLLFQYFGDKTNLYASVIHRADEQMRAFQYRALTELLEGELKDDVDHYKSLLRTFLHAYFDYLVEHPNFLRILNWEMAEGWQTFSKIAGEADLEEMAALNTALQKIAGSGWLRSASNPMSQFVLALFTSQLYLSLLPLIRIYMPDLDANSTEGLAQTRDFIVEFIVHGLIAEPNER